MAQKEKDSRIGGKRRTIDKRHTDWIERRENLKGRLKYGGQNEKKKLSWWIKRGMKNDANENERKRWNPRKNSMLIFRNWKILKKTNKK